MSLLNQHLPVLPVAIPMVAAALMVMLRDKRRHYKLLIAFGSLLAQLFCAVYLLLLADGTLAPIWPQSVGVYLLGDWPAPFGIVLVVDRLAAFLLVLTNVLAFCCWFYSLARWDRVGVHFHSLFQLLLMGLNGAFLTGDLFNLFVFFEVLLAASYGLMLHGSGAARVSAGLHYIAVNLISSFLLLIAIALIYGVTGTLNMADLALRAGSLPDADRLVFESALAILGIAFLIKAAAWPLNLWLPNAYGNASAPVAAMFAIMTKVGIYALLRIGSLLLPTGAPAAFGVAWMFPAGIATLTFGAIGVMAAQQPERLASYCIIVSSGTLLAALGMPGVILTGPALYYMLSSVLALGAFFLLLELVSRTKPFGADLLAVSQEIFDLDDPESEDHSDDVVGVAIPGVMVFLGMSFIACALLIVGLPPLSGFVAKLSLLTAALKASGQSPEPLNAWILTAAVLISGVAGLIAMVRVGIRLFWSNSSLTIPRLKLIEAAPIASIIVACAILSWYAGPITTYLEQTAQQLDEPRIYIGSVLRQNPVRSVQAEGF
ncbi:monovalent cation/H+ antiporter subunit D [Alcaligenes faecalis]|nr:monovalent cation/H+ antiporter subunit D [Alcaligenes faecalis]